jgi:hypothetical protein
MIVQYQIVTIPGSLVLYHFKSLAALALESANVPIDRSGSWPRIAS